MDLETAMMVVQSNRANLLESQLKDQIGAVQARNDQINRLNQALAALNKAAAGFSSDAKAGDKLRDTPFKNNDFAMEKEINSAFATAGVRPFTSNGDQWSAQGRLQQGGVYQGGVGGDTTKGQVDAAANQLRSMIDSQSNNQQMDMLRTQGLSNRYNETVDTITNFMKKMSDNRAGIVRNI
jgi:hypothetical protein